LIGERILSFFFSKLARNPVRIEWEMDGGCDQNDKKKNKFWLVFVERNDFGEDLLLTRGSEWASHSSCRR
jgi:hypothetical protein